MSKRTIMIVATDMQGGIGKDGGIPWKAPADMRRFKERTTGHALVMGRATYDSIGRPLPNRITYVISRQPGLRIEGVEVFSTPEAALEAARARHDTVFVAGGAQIYRALLSKCDVVERTLIPGAYDCDTKLDLDFHEEFELHGVENGEDGLEFETWTRKR